MQPKELPETVSAATLAWLFGVNPRHIRKLAAAGVLRRVGRGAYPLAESIQAHTAWRAGETERRNRSESADSLREARAAEIRMRMDREQRKLIPMAESLIDREFVIGKFIRALDSLPARITRDVRERHRITAITDDIRERLSQDFDRARKILLAGGDPYND